MLVNKYEFGKPAIWHIDSVEDRIQYGPLHPVRTEARAPVAREAKPQTPRISEDDLMKIEQMGGLGAYNARGAAAFDDRNPFD